MWRNIWNAGTGSDPESKIHGRGEKKVKRTSGIWDIINPFAGKDKKER